MEELGLACLPEDLDLIKRRIGEQGLNRIVIAGCSRWEIRGPIEEMAKGMGFNPTLIEYANIREQCAFVHEDHPKSATEKADGPDQDGGGEGKTDSADSKRKTEG